VSTIGKNFLIKITIGSGITKCGKNITNLGSLKITKVSQVLQIGQKLQVEHNITT